MIMSRYWSKVNYVLVVLHLARISGILPVHWTNRPSKRGKHNHCKDFKLSASAGIFSLFQLAVTCQLIYLRLTSGLWRQQGKIPFKVEAAMIIVAAEIVRVVTIMVGLIFRVRRGLLKCLNQSSSVLNGLEDQKISFWGSGILLLVMYIGFAANRLRLTIMNTVHLTLFHMVYVQGTMLKILLVCFTRIVATSFKYVNDQLVEFTLEKNTVIAPNHLHYLCLRHALTCKFFYNVSYCFGPDLLFSCIHSLFKITLHGYVLFFYITGLKGYWPNMPVPILEIIFQIITIYLIAANCDVAVSEQKKTRVLLLQILAEKGRILSQNNIENLRVFMMQSRSQTRNFSVCDHFNLNRSLICKLVLMSVTYIVMMIQFHTFQ